MLKIELLANQAVRAAIQGDESTSVDFLVDLFNEANRYPGQLAQVQDHAVVGNAFLLMLMQNISSDDDSLQQMASVAYLFLTKAIERTVENTNLIKNRVLLMHNAQQHLIWTVISALGPASSAQSILGSVSPASAKGMIYKMLLSDLETNFELMKLSELVNMKAEIYTMITSGSFGPNATRETLSRAGYEAHKKLLYYLYNKIVKEGDIEF